MAVSELITDNNIPLIRHFVPDNESGKVFELVNWEKRNAQIKNVKGEVVFEQKNVEIPQFWSQTATNIVVSKYFSGSLGSSKRETSVRQLIGRVVNTIAMWGEKDNYFHNETSKEIFRDELIHIILHQYATFNSPVWFNVGIEEKAQCSACFINSIEDNMESILELTKTEGMLFKWGSGTGTNLSPLRSSVEELSRGGIASGPVSFMKGYDAFAGVIKSGGKTRRAAKMVILNIEHPDIMEFIRSKANEERKAWALIDAGYDGSIDGEAYNSVFFQNANHSVRVTDEFMKSVENNEDFYTRRVLTGQKFKKYKARDMLKEIAEATHVCGDPGLQFDTTINNWHTSSNTDRIHASNPCSEYLYLNNSACNLSSINLLKYLDSNCEFDVDSYIQTIRIMILAQEILVSNASYPTVRIGRNSEDYRPLGLGYANIGALLMAMGLPYDSGSGRALAGVLTAIMSGEGYYQSALIARKLGPFNGYEKNKEPMLRVMKKHQSFIDKIDTNFVSPNLIKVATSTWDSVVKLGEQYGFRNGQISVLAPTGTIAFMLDCATTGVEPDIALVKYKNLVGGGQIKIVNQTVPQALQQLGYTIEQQTKILVHLEENDTIEGALDLRDSDLPVFDCAFKPRNGKRFIHYMGHVHMMAAVQPFISGAISKTVNVPTNITADEIADIYVQAWKMGIKAIAIYRDGSKRIQPLSMDSKGKAVKTAKSKEINKYKRRRLPDTRNSITHKFSIESHEGYLTVGMYEDGKPGEIFVTMAKEGSTISGLMDSFALAISMLLQHNIELKDLVNKFAHLRFEPSGLTRNPDIPFAKSIIDYIFRWLAIQFLPQATSEEVIKPQKQLGDMGQFNSDLIPQKANPSKKLNNFFSERDLSENEVYTAQSDAPPCSDCGAIMTRSGSCYRCLECGSTSGCS
ncbi:MAG: Vitamin B12-dependent ribonucleotide reductase [Candidatus Heimdallarchaeota archaeon LC_3]|nr:MAG: Vitamin B12-dependent ribonucleotide reductase [Candidatus Heimdallarchaeota archaeon LC_3]